jgi:hypothetical protein
MILVPLLNPKFATVPAAKSCELRVRGTGAAFEPEDRSRIRREVRANFGFAALAAIMTAR